MSLLDLDAARADYRAWVEGTDDPPTIDEDEARLLSFRITAHHFPNLLAAHDQLFDENKALQQQVHWQTEATKSHWAKVQRLRSVIDQATKLADEWTAMVKAIETVPIASDTTALDRCQVLRYTAQSLREVLSAVPETTQVRTMSTRSRYLEPGL